MLQFLTYQTPSKFSNEFEEYSIKQNLLSVRALCIIILCISSGIRVVSLFFHDDFLKIPSHDQLSVNNWLQIAGSTFFLLVYKYVAKQKPRRSIRKMVVIAFIAYLLTIAFNTSHVISMHNTKNTLFIFLVGIVSVSLFFAVNLKHIRWITLYIVTVYIATTWMSQLPIEQKILNLVSAAILGSVLLSFSRYSYYVKSSHFVQIKELETKNKEISNLNMQKSEILSFVAHDLRAPLNNIGALSRLLQMENGNIPEIEMIASSATQAKNIINDLIEAAKTQQTDVEKENIALEPFLSKTIENWQLKTDRIIELVIPTEEITLYANPSKIERVLDNLISNALKFSPPAVPVEVIVSKHENQIIIEVKDHGMGIPSQLLPHVFDRFSKAGRKGLQGESSIGLGLHISHKIIEQHHGALTVSSEENRGTTFKIQLPSGAN